MAPTASSLFSGPWHGPTNNVAAPAYQGKAAIALKRTVSRAGHFPWRRFNAHYNKALEQAVRTIQKTHGLTPTGQCDRLTFKVLQKLKGGDGKPAMDAVAVHLLEEEYHRLYPPQPTKAHLEAKVKAALSDYWAICIAHAQIWHYNRGRPEDYSVPPAAGGYDDCSSKATSSFYYARKKTGIPVPDPNGNGFDGTGNTVTLYQHNSSRRVTNGHYEVGDLGLYGFGASHHVVVCTKAGDSSTSVWGSNGSEAGPYYVRLHYRNDLFAVVRPQLTP